MERMTLFIFIKFQGLLDGELIVEICLIFLKEFSLEFDFPV